MESCTLRSKGFCYCCDVIKKSPVPNFNLSCHKNHIRKTGRKEHVVHLILGRPLQLCLVFIEFSENSGCFSSLLCQYVSVGKSEPHVVISGIPERPHDPPNLLSLVLGYLQFPYKFLLYCQSKVAKSIATL